MAAHGFTELSVITDVERVQLGLDRARMVDGDNGEAALTAVGLLRHATTNGKAGVIVLVTLADGRQVPAQTTWACFRTAYAALAASPIVAEEVIEP